MLFKTTVTAILLVLMSFTALFAQDYDRVDKLLADIDQWVVTDTTRITKYIDSTDAVAMETLKSSKFWDMVETELGFLLGIDLITSPQVDNTGRMYFRMRLSGESDALFYVDKPMGFPIQITPNNWTDEGFSISGYSVHPSGDFILVQVNKFNDEMHDIWLFERNGQFRPLLVSRDTRYYIAGFDEDNPDRFFTLIFKSPNIHYGSYTISTATLDTLYHEPGSNYITDYYKDKILLTRSISFSESQLAMLDLKTKKVIDLTDVTQLSMGSFTTDGKVLLLTSAKSKEDEFMKFCLLDPAKPKKMTVIYDPKLETEEIMFHREMGIVVTALNQDGFSVLHGFDLEGNEIPMPKLDVGVISEYSGSAISANDNGQIVFSYSSPTVPPTAYTFKLNENKIQQIGKVSTFGFDFSNIKVDVIRYPSEDGTMIPALIYVPKDAKKDGSNPAIIQYHGGPPGQSRPYFQRNIAFALSKGFIMMFPNVRGSTGYGPAWEEADNQERRFTALKDAETAIDYLINEGYSSPETIAIWGGSYGGYTVNWLAGHCSDKIACVVSEIAVSDIEHNLAYTGVGTFIEGYEREYGKRGTKLLKQLSPIYYAENVNKPILFRTGHYDPRVPPSDSRRFASVLQQLGKPVLHYEEMESGHGGSFKSQVIFELTSNYVFTMMHVMK
jgi:dipeptidyl aminopeptidase/acylaminoacyl peptidase